MLFSEREEEFQPAFIAVFGVDVATMEHNSVFHDREAESGAAILSTAAFVDTKESLEQAWQVLVAYPLASVVELDVVMTVILSLIALDDYGDVIAGVHDGILYQIAEDRVD